MLQVIANSVQEDITYLQASVSNAKSPVLMTAKIVMQIILLSVRFVMTDFIWAGICARRVLLNVEHALPARDVSPATMDILWWKYWELKQGDVMNVPSTMGSAKLVFSHPPSV